MKTSVVIRDTILLFCLKYKRFLMAGLFVLLVLTPLIFSSRYQLRVLNIALISVLPALGLSVLSGYTGQSSMCQASFFGLGAYFASITANMGIFNIWVAIFLAPFVVALAALVVGIPALRLRGFYLVLLTVAISSVCTTLVSRLKITNQTFGLRLEPALSLFGISLNNGRNFFYFIIIVDAIALYFMSRFANSSYGILMRTVRQNPAAASMVGVNLTIQRVGAFMISGGLAAFGGGLYCGYLRFSSPEMMIAAESITLLAAVTIGGMGIMGGSAMGAILLKILPELLRGFKNYYYIVYALIIMIFMIYMPWGIAGQLRIWLIQARQREYARQMRDSAERREDNGH
jgi:branched-chain amino acid transport system permease protein